MTTPNKTAIALLAVSSLMAAPALSQDNLAFLGTSMFGEYEVGGQGAGEEASGDFSAELDLDSGQICYMLELDGIEDFAAAHIHKAPAGENGPPVMTLELMGPEGDDVCTQADVELLKDIAKNKADYYVNVHTTAFPAGAIRGQLGQ
jgi:hypothetical protein